MPDLPPEGAAGALAVVVIDTLRDENDNIHAETAIVSIAAVAGTLLLRGAEIGDGLDSFTPGTTLLSDEVNDAGIELLG